VNCARALLTNAKMVAPTIRADNRFLLEFFMGSIFMVNIYSDSIATLQKKQE
jgi:hypothetical protein